MGRGFFEYISDIINGTPKNKKTIGAQETAESTIYDNNIDREEKLQDAIIAILKSNYLGLQDSFNKKSLIIWIDDNLFYNSITKSDFKESLIRGLDSELGCIFNSIEFRLGQAAKELCLKEVFPSVSLQVLEANEVSAIRVAQISPVEGNGSTLDPYYILDSQKIQSMPNARYNIGIGKHPMMSDNSYRENYIAIDDNPESPQFSRNRYVSRAHAYISFSEEYGFLLNVEYGGTRAAQKRTHIYRGSIKIELNNTLIPEPLKDGDYIVLSKYVYLLFKENQQSIR